MKLSKVLSLVLAVVMLFGMQSFAFTDVAATANYAEAVQVLSALNILKGYDDGSFKPEGKITRAEYATIVCRILNMGDAGANQVGGYFTDVTADHWASGYIATASQLGIVNGMGDGTFAPEAEVTYEQSVAMLVRALGYELKAQSMGGYPTGYMMIANQESITVGTANAAGGASRATVARLTYNALTVPMMGQTAWGSDVEFKAQEDESILFSKLDAVKVEATIDVVKLDPEVEVIDLTNVKFDKVATENDATNFPEAGKTTLTGVKINGVDLVGLQGVRATVILDKSEGNQSTELKLIAVVAKSGKNIELNIEPSLLDTFDTTNNVAKYYKSNDDDKTTEIKLDTTVTVYKNVVKGSTSDVKKGGNAGDVSYKFVDTDNNGAYDVVFVANESVFVVDKVVGDKIYVAGSAKTNITNPYGKAFLKLDVEDDYTTWNITDAEGNALEVADIKSGDVLAVKESKDGSYYYYEIVVSSESVEGTITETFEEDLKTGGKLDMFKIDGVAYSRLDKSAMTPGDTITAKVYNGKVVAYEVAAGIENYGVIVNAGTVNGLETEHQVQILTQKGELVTFVLADEVNATPVPTPVTSQYVTGAIIAYELNKEGEIKKADVQGTLSGNVLDTGYGFAPKATAVPYKASAEKLGSYFITENTIIFATEDSSINKDNISLVNADIFADQETYDFTAIYSDTKEAVVVVLFEATAQIDYTTYPIYVTKTSKTTVDGEQRNKVTGYVADADGIIDEDVKVEFVVADKAKNDAKSLVAGDVAFFATNAAGEICDAKILATKSGSDYKVLDTAIAGAKDEDKTATTGKYIVLSGAEITGVDTTAKAKTAAAAAMTTPAPTATPAPDALKGFAAAGKAYDVRGGLVRLVNADDYANTFDTTNNVRDYDKSGTDEGAINDYFATDVSAYVYNAQTGKVTISLLSTIETDSLSDKDHSDQLDNDDLVYIYNYDGETKLVLIIDVNGDN